MKVLKPKPKFEPSHLQVKKAQIVEEVFTKKVELENLEEQFEAKKASLQGDLDEFVLKIQGVEATLTSEVRQLEDRREAALRPLEDRERVVEVREAALDQRDKAIEEVETRQATERRNLIDRLSFVKDQESQAQETIAEADKIMAGAKAQADFTQQSAKALNGKWVEFHQVVTETDTRIEGERDENRAQKHILDVRDEQQDKRQIDLDNQERLIKDRYNTLLRTIERTK